MISTVTFALAGAVFERARAKGESLETAMREAEQALRAAQRAERTATELPPFARQVLEQVAHHYRVTVEAMQLRGGDRGPRGDARDEAAYILMKAGLTPEQIGRLIRRDRYAAIGGERRFAQQELKLGPVPRARIQRAVDAALALKAYQEAPPPRRPPLKAPSPSRQPSVSERKA